MMLIEVIGGIIQWVIFPILYLQYTFYQQLKKQDKELAVLQAKSEVQTQSTDRELKEIKQTVDRIFAKLDSLENNLRK